MLIAMAGIVDDAPPGVAGESPMVAACRERAAITMSPPRSLPLPTSANLTPQDHSKPIVAWSSMGNDRPPLAPSAAKAVCWAALRSRWGIVVAWRLR